MESLHKLTVWIIAIAAAFLLALIVMNWHTDYVMAKQGLCYGSIERTNISAQNQWQRCK